MKRVPGRNLFFRPELGNGNIVVVTPRGQQVGCVWWRPTGRQTVEVEHLEVDERYQNTGLGEALLREFAANFPTLYPEVRFVTGKATSQGIVRLLRRVFGQEHGQASAADLPRRSPSDWISTRNRVHVRFRAAPRESVSARDIVKFLLEDDANGIDLARRATRWLCQHDPDFFEGGCAEVCQVISQFLERRGIPVRLVTGYAVWTHERVPHAWLELDGARFDPVYSLQRIRPRRYEPQPMELGDFGVNEESPYHEELVQQLQKEL